MTKSRFEFICDLAVRTLRERAPKDTGNLAYNGIRFEWINSKTFNIYVDESIAEYMPFTNEKWISPKWHGKKNPNEGWFQDAVELILAMIQSETKGTLKNDFT